MRTMAIFKLLLAAIILAVLILLPFRQGQPQCYVCWKWQFDFFVSLEFEHCFRLHCAELEIDNW